MSISKGRSGSWTGVLTPNAEGSTAFTQIDTETPPDTLIASEDSSEYDATQLNTISVDDSNNVLASSATKYSSHRLKVKIGAIPDSMTLLAKGYGTGGGADEGWKMYIWNFTTSTWGVELDSHTTDGKDTLSAVISEDVGDYVDEDGYVQVLLSAYTGTALAGSTSRLYYFELAI